MEAAFCLLEQTPGRPVPFAPPPPTLSGLWAASSSVAAPGGRSCGSRLGHWRAAQSQAFLALDFSKGARLSGMDP